MKLNFTTPKPRSKLPLEPFASKQSAQWSFVYRKVFGFAQETAIQSRFCCYDKQINARNIEEAK